MSNTTTMLWKAQYQHLEAQLEKFMADAPVLAPRASPIHQAAGTGTTPQQCLSCGAYKQPDGTLPCDH